MHGIAEVLPLIFHVAAGKEKTALNEQPIFYSRGWTVSQTQQSCKGWKLSPQEKSGLRCDLQQPLCTLSRQVKAHTSADSRRFGDILLSLSNKSNVLVQEQLYSLSLCFLHVSLPTVPLKLHVNTCHCCP